MTSNIQETRHRKIYAPKYKRYSYIQHIKKINTTVKLTSLNNYRLHRNFI